MIITHDFILTPSWTYADGRTRTYQSMTDGYWRMALDYRGPNIAARLKQHFEVRYPGTTVTVKVEPNYEAAFYTRGFLPDQH